LGNRKITKVFQNAKFDLTMLRSTGFTIAGRVEELQFAVHALDSLEKLALKGLVRKFLGEDRTRGEGDQAQLKRSVMRARRKAKVEGWPAADHWMADAWLGDPELLETYARKDALDTMVLWLHFSRECKREKVWKNYERERNLLRVTMAMETRGIFCDVKIASESVERAEDRAEKHQRSIEKHAPGLNPGSPKQLSEVLFTDLGLDPVTFTPSGQPSTDAKVMEALDHPLPRAIVKYRAALKEADFFRKYGALADENGIVHPNFRQLGARTSRYSCAQPNLQNVPNALTTRGSEPIQARTCFGPRKDHVWWHFDYSQLEVRIFADVAREEGMLEAMREGRDLHTTAANRAWGGQGNPAAIRAAEHALELDGSGLDEKSPEVRAALDEYGCLELPEDIASAWLRSFSWDIVAAEKSLRKKVSRAKAKMLVFLKVFGGGANAAMDLIGCDFAEAVLTLQEYDDAFPRISEFQAHLSREAMRNGCIRTRFGYRLGVDRDKPYRAVNYEVQGSAAGLLKKVTQDTYDFLKAEGLCWGCTSFTKTCNPEGAHIVLTIHDELVFEVHRSRAKKRLARRIRSIMEDHGGALGVSVPVEMAITKDFWVNKRGAKLDGR